MATMCCKGLSVFLLFTMPDLKAVNIEVMGLYAYPLGMIKEQDPDLLCVFRRKRGFFKKLWEKNVILKEEFNCDVPLLILRGKL